MAGPGTESPPPWLRPASAIALVVAIVLAGVGLFLPLADFDVDTKVGSTSFVLDSEWTAGSVEYTGAAPEMSVEVEGSQDFLGGIGEFQEKIGFIKGTSKTRTNYIVPYTNDYSRKRAQLNVTIRTETIPWWVVGVAVPCEVEVELVESMNVTSLIIDRVYFQFHRKVNGTDQVKDAWSLETADPMTEVGQKRTYKVDLEATSDWGQFDVFGMINVTMVDVDDITATHFYRSYSTEPMMITLWTIPTSEGARIALLIVAMPAIVAGMVLAAAAVLAVLRPLKGRLYIAGGAAALLLLGALFFSMGLGQLTEVVGYPDDLAYLGGYTVLMLAFVPAVAAAVLVGVEMGRYPPREADEGAMPPTEIDPTAQYDQDEEG